MRYTIDTEFWEDGYQLPVQLISIGIVSETGQKYYAVNKDFDWTKVPPKHWLWENVKPRLFLDDMDPKKIMKSRQQIKQELLTFFRNDPAPEFWAWFADYDWVVFCQIFGTMIALAPNFPQLCMDIEQKRRMLQLSRAVFPPKFQPEHNALVDALWDMQALINLNVHEKKILDRIGTGTV